MPLSGGAKEELKAVLHRGPNSISTKLPKPRVYYVGGGHSFADVEDILSIMFAGATHVSFINEWAGSEVE